MSTHAEQGWETQAGHAAGDPTPDINLPAYAGLTPDEFDRCAVIPGATVNRIVSYIEDRLGQGAVDRIIDLARFGGRRQDLDDLTHLFTYAEGTALLRAACTVLGVPDAAVQIGEARDLPIERIGSPAASTLYELARAYPTPRAAMAAVPLATPRYSPAQRSELLEVTDDGATVAISGLGVSDAHDRTLWCGFTAGLIGVPSRALGYHVEVTETECEADGAGRCVFSVRWWATPEDEELQLEAMRRRLALATRQLQLLQEVPAELVADIEREELLERIVDHARHAVLGSAHILAVETVDGRNLEVHARGLDPIDADLVGHQITGVPGLDPNRLVADVASGRHHHGRLAVLRSPGEPAFLPEERRMLDAFARTAAAALDVAGALAQARELSMRDPLTGLPSRQLFHDRLEQALALARRRGLAGAVVLVDLDGFRSVNETRGPAAGDELLVQVGHRLGVSLRGSDTVARFVDDEFTVLLPELQGADALDKVTARLCAAFDDPFHLDGEPLHLRASVGVATFPASGDTARSILTRAHEQMTAMKSALRDTSWWSAPDPS